MSECGAALAALSLDDPAISRDDIQYRPFCPSDPTLVEQLSQMMASELSEPYSVFTYYYFLQNWPTLCFLAYHNDKMVGVILGKLECHQPSISGMGATKRGYIAMIVVSQQYRRLGIGKRLVGLYNQQVIQQDGDEIVLETEADNHGSLALYEHLGFFRDKKLMNYYMNGKDAYRLKMVLKLDKEETDDHHD